VRPHPKASLVFLLVGIGFVIAFFVSLPIWDYFYEPKGMIDLLPFAVMLPLCGIPAIVCGLISLGLGLHALRTHRWVLIWTVPLFMLAIWSFGGGLLKLLHRGTDTLAIIGLVSGGLSIGFLIAVLVTAARRTE